MKFPRFLACLPLMAFAGITAIAQQPGPPRSPRPQVNLGQPGDGAAPASQPEAKPFSLEFRGGPVQSFVEAVEKATGEPFNLIIPEAAQDLIIPPVRVREVTLHPLLSALSATSMERKAVATGQTMLAAGPQRMTPSFEWRSTGFTFTPTTGSGGSLVWQLVVEKLPPLPEAPAPTPIARFYQVKANLEAGLKIEDITTVAQTAWKMMKLKDTEIPQLKVHEESGILIAVGSEAALGVIDSVLKELPKKQATGLAPLGTVVPPAVQGPQISPPRVR